MPVNHSVSPFMASCSFIAFHWFGLFEQLYKVPAEVCLPLSLSVCVCVCCCQVYRRCFSLMKDGRFPQVCSDTLSSERTKADGNESNMSAVF